MKKKQTLNKQLFKNVSIEYFRVNENKNKLDLKSFRQKKMLYYVPNTGQTTHTREGQKTANNRIERRRKKTQTIWFLNHCVLCLLAVPVIDENEIQQYEMSERKNK